METTHTYATLRFIVPVEGKKVYSLLPIFLNHPFTLYKYCEYSKQRTGRGRSSVLEGERNKGRETEKLQLRVGGRARSERKGKASEKDQVAGETLRQKMRIKITESSKLNTTKPTPRQQRNNLRLSF